MADPFSGAFAGELVGTIRKIIERGENYRGTLREFKSLLEDLKPVVNEIQQCNEKMDLPTDEYIDNLKAKIKASEELIGKYSQINWWNWILMPYYQSKLKKGRDSIVSFITVQMQPQIVKLLKQILSRLDSHELPPISDDDHTSTGTPISSIGSEFTVKLNGPLKERLRFELTRDGGEHVINLNGLAGSGKTTLTEQLCRDPQVTGKFEKGIVWLTLGSQIQSNEHRANQNLKKCLGRVGKSPVLLVLDDVWPISIDLVEELKLKFKQSSNSKILVTSRFQLTELGTLSYSMMPLGEDNAEKLLFHFVEPSNIITSYNNGDPDIRRTVLRIVKGCKGLPLTLKFIGSQLRGKPIESWQTMETEWSQQGHSVLDSHNELLTRLQNSLHVLEDKSIIECFMDLGLFPEDQRIPITALIDMWTELYNVLDNDGKCAMIFIHQLSSMNLADILVRRKVGSDADNYYNNHFLMQHDLFRELAIRMSNEDTFEMRKRLIIDINGDDPPDWWAQQQQQQGIFANILSFFHKWLIQPNQQRVAAHIVSISTNQKITPHWCNIQAGEAEVFVLNLQANEYTLPEFIKKMRNLKVVMITNYVHSTTEIKNLGLLVSLGRLKRIRLQHVSIPHLWESKNVTKLSLFMCHVKKAFENSSMLISKAMPNLEDLNIEYCRDMVELPDGLCDIVTLKKLIISSCHNFTKLPQEIEKLENLEVLRVSYCASFEEMPESMGRLQKLSLLDISHCGSLARIPDSIFELRSLRKLYMTGCPVRDLPESVKKMEHLSDVRCDDNTYAIWESIQDKPRTLIIKTDKDITLNWLPEFGRSHSF